MSDPETFQERIQKQSWISRLILLCPDSGSSSPGCAFSNGKKPHQHAFTTRIVPPSDNCRSLLTVTKGVLFSNLEPVPFDPNLDVEPETCFNCRKKSLHKYKNCYKQKTLFCYNCGRRDVQVTDCPRCAKGYPRFEEKYGKPKELMSSRSMDIPSSRNKSRARSRGRTPSDSKDKRTRNVESFDSRSAKDKSRGQSKSVAWFDSPDVRGDGMENRLRKACGRRNNNISDNYEVKDNKSESRSANGTTREFLDLMAAIKHLPSETQNALVLHFLDEGRVKNRGDVKLE